MYPDGLAREVIENRSHFVGWDDARSESIAGGRALLDVDSFAGAEGPESMLFTEMIAGVTEIWVNLYDGKFEAEEVATCPAKVDIYCDSCENAEGKMGSGLVESVVQSTRHIPEGGKRWWKVRHMSIQGQSCQLRGAKDWHIVVLLFLFQSL